MTKKPKFYRLDNIMKVDAQYYMAFGERGNGKTFSGLERIVERWIENEECGVYVRRYDDDIKGAMGEKVWRDFGSQGQGIISKMTGGEWTDVHYFKREYYLCRYDNNGKKIVQPFPFCYAMAVNLGDRNKGGQYPNVTTIMYDEFITRERYLVDEFTKFMNLISTVIRHHAKAKVLLFGNTVDMACPHFRHMGLVGKNAVSTMEPGEIRTVYFGQDRELVVRIEYCENTGESGGKESDPYFAFDNSKNKMITEGAWEMPQYPIMPKYIAPSSVVEKFYIQYHETILEGRVILNDYDYFLTISQYKEEKLSDDILENNMIFSLEFNPRYNHAICPIKGYRNKLHKTIGDLFQQNLCYFDENLTGDKMRGYINESSQVDLVSL